MLKAVIFDIDGTLVDSNDLHAQSWQETFKYFGYEIAFARVRQQIGKGSDQLLPEFFTEDELEEFGEAMQKYRGQLYKREYLPHVTAFPGVRELFQRVRADGRRIALASSAKEDELATYKKLARIEDLVEVQTSVDDAEKSKPYPDIFAAALDQLGDVTPEQAIVIGDTPYDAQAAGIINLPAIGVLSGGFAEQELRAAGCVHIYQNVADLLAHYEASPLAPEV